MENKEKWCLAIHKANFDIRYIELEDDISTVLEKDDYLMKDFVFYKLRDNMEYRSEVLYELKGQSK